MVFWLLSKI